ncbi:hypothetical protein [Streptomyces sp. NPDC059649]|uniref:hypothetical protein n=1 Tax=Streptomyces sp. NPDC059649 TaxID=3346895 RepID=UPI00368A56D1
MLLLFLASLTFFVFLVFFGSFGSLLRWGRLPSSRSVGLVDVDQPGRSVRPAR